MSAVARLAAQDLVVSHRRGVEVIPGLSVAIDRGTVTALVGPNGCGKSTLLAALARVIRPAAGTVRFDGADLSGLPSREVARRLTLLPQVASAPPGCTVLDLVHQGRYPHRGLWGMARGAPDEQVRRAVALVGLEGKEGRALETLSGGERQRAWIALALAQEAELLLLDEPTTYLDVRHQVDLMELVVRLRDEHARTVVMVLHDLNQAARYADRMIMMRAGRVMADGPPAQVLTPARVEEVFDLRAVVVPDPVTGRPMVVPR